MLLTLVLLLFFCLAFVVSCARQRPVHALLSWFAGAACAALLVGCRTAVPDSRPPASDSLQAQAPWLTPPPAGSTPAQARKWNRAQRRALVEACKPAGTGKVKVKNSGNTKAKSDYTLRQREKLNQYDRSKQKSRDDFRDQTAKKADLSQKAVSKTGLTIPFGVWIVVGVVAIVLLLLLFLRGRL